MSPKKSNNSVFIANPIYDVVFRYLMEDNLSARMFIGVVLGVEVLELEFKPTDSTHKITGTENIVTVTRMDFNARIKDEKHGERLVIIELQKAQYHHQIMRFRKYLGKQYQKPGNKIKEETPLPIFPIYILGDAFTEEEIPVIRVNRQYVNAATQEIIEKKYVFIESLTHDAVVIQINRLKQNRRTRLERFLSIFDQTAKTEDSDGHILEINQSEYPEEYERIIRRLESVVGSPKLEETMDMEDEILSEFNLRDKKLAEQKEIAERAENKVRKMILSLYKPDMTLVQIADISGLSVSEAEEIILKVKE